MDIEDVIRSLRVYTRNADAMDALDEETVREVLESALSKFAAVDRWLSRGGFLPKDWARRS